MFTLFCYWLAFYGLIVLVGSLAEVEASEVDILTRPGRSNPVNMPDAIDMPIQDLPVITGEGSASNSLSGISVASVF